MISVGIGVSVFVLAFVVIVLVASKPSAKAEEEARKKAEDARAAKKKRLDDYENALTEMKQSYGNITIELPLVGGTGDGYYATQLSAHLYFFEEAQMAVLANRHVPFGKIISYSLTDNQQTIATTTGNAQTNTSTASMAGRALVGGVLLGGAGAVAGAVTAKRDTAINTSTKYSTSHDFKIYLTIDDLASPQMCLSFASDEKSATKAASVFDVIIRRNN